MFSLFNQTLKNQVNGYRFITQKRMQLKDVLSKTFKTKF